VLFSLAAAYGRTFVVNWRQVGRHSPTNWRDTYQPAVSPVCKVSSPASVRDSKGKGSPYSTTERRVPELIPVLGSQPAGDVSHKTGGRLPLLSVRPAVTPATLKRAATNFAAW